MRIQFLSFAAVAVFAFTTSVMAAPSVSGVSGCILNNGAKAGSVSYQPAKSGGGSGSGGNSGGGRDSGASVSSNFPNCGSGNNGTWNSVNTVNANEVNSAFWQMEQQTNAAIHNAVQNSTAAIRNEYNNAIAQNKQRIEVNTKDPVDNVRGPNDGVFSTSTKGYVGVTISTRISDITANGTDITSAGAAFR
ncbi:hypothetical protein [Brucella thiophenivorans]|uniref:Uncharacterized protein n=1 Tax=Brucella thiophenivorans TaxID=571255 RepID=A0A256FTM3_9HYPH|nr:hypothetical protein [Brucella thiophenivorans]OYR18225.1 hypothetical protein CEV31_4237 [Brucella thiophenivorans]